MELAIEYTDSRIAVNAFVWTPKPYKQPLHSHTSLELGFCLSGSGFFYFGDKRYAVSPGDVFVVNNRELHIAESNPADPSRYLFLNFDPALLLPDDRLLLLPFFYRSDSFDNRIPASWPAAAELAQLMRTVHGELERKEDGYDSMVKSALLRIGVLLLRIYSARMPDREWREATASFGKLRTMLEFAETRFREPLQLSDLAEYMGMTADAAGRLFSRLVGSGFSAYLRKLRLNEAKRRLLGTDEDVTAVCFDSGFQSLSSFYRLFAEDAGCTPQAFREANPRR